MAGPQYTTEKLIESIERRCIVPQSQLTYEPTDFCALATDEMQEEVVPLLMSTREEYFVDFVDVPSPADGVIDFPVGTVASKVRSVAYLQQSNPLVLLNLPRIDLDVVTGVGFSTGMTSLAGFYLQANSICLYPANSVPTGTMIRIYYYKRTLNLAAPEEYSQVVAVNTLDNSIQVGSIPSDWVAGTVLNSVSSSTPFQVTNSGCTIQSLSAPTIYLDTVEGIEIGDYVSLQGYSAIPQIPIEAHGYLAQLTAAKCLEGLGDRDGMVAALKKAESLKTNLLTMLTQRVDGSVKKIINPNGGLRSSGWRRGWGG